MKYFIWLNDQQTGPVSSETLLSMRRDNIITADTLVFVEGADDWVTYSSLSMGEFQSSETTLERSVKVNAGAETKSAKFPFLAILIIVIALSCVGAVSLFTLSHRKQNVEVEKQDINVNVQAFIVTNGGENIKLGLVDVAAYPKDKVLAALLPFLRERRKTEEQLSQASETESKDYDSKLAVLSKQSDESDQVLERATADRDTAIKTLHDALMSVYDIGKQYIEQQRVKLNLPDDWYIDNDNSVDPNTVMLRNLSKQLDLDTLINGIDGLPDENSLGPWFKKWRDLLARGAWAGLAAQRDALLRVISQAEVADANKQKAQAARNSAKDAYESLSSSPRSPSSNTLSTILNNSDLFSKLPEASVVEKTNADGECQLELPKSGDWVVSASAQRMVGDKTEKYAWIIEVPSDLQSGKPLILSNDNLLIEGGVPQFCDAQMLAQ